MQRARARARPVSFCVEGPSTMDMTILGIDIAKSVFQLHGIDADGAVVAQKKLRRGAVLNFLGKVGPCLIGMKACATSHYWAWLRVYVHRKRLG